MENSPGDPSTHPASAGPAKDSPACDGAGALSGLHIVKAGGLTKYFGSLAAVDHIDFSVGKQKCFGFLGPNGAGKTTVVRMISCFFEPSQGILEVLGRRVEEAPRFIKERIGVLPQEDNLDPDLSVEANLRVFARYFDLGGKETAQRRDELLHSLGLFSKKKARIDELSGGMKRRLMVARSLLNRPSLLLLDEPTTGLDPQARHQIWETLHQLKIEGTTIVLTTHYMEEAAQLCDFLVVMDKGKIIEEGTPRELVNEHIGSAVIEIPSGKAGVESYAKSKGLNCEKTSTHFFIYGPRVSSHWPEISRKFGEESCVFRTANLEDVFLKLTGRELRE